MFLINIILKVSFVQYTYKCRKLDVPELISDVKTLSGLAKKGVELKTSLYLYSNNTSDFIESKVVEIIDNQVKYYVFFNKFKMNLIS